MKVRTLATLFLFLAASAASAQDVLVIAPKEFQPAADAWRKHREKQGLAVAFREPPPEGSSIAIVKEVHEKSGKKLRFVMLLGDAEKVPCSFRLRGADATLLGAPPDEQIATDNASADLDGDGVPDLAIGRVPADTAVEAREYLDRVVAYETSSDFGAWRSKLNVVAGTGGFGPLVDGALENLSRQLIAEGVPPAVDVKMTYANPISPFCPPPAEFADYAVRRWSEGALIVAYVGHGHEHGVDRVRNRDKEFPILEQEHVAKIAASNGAPISMFIACSTGRFDAPGPKDCLAEDLLKRPKGPVAVIASSRISSPYSNAILAKELLTAIYRTEIATTGELLLEIKQRLVKPVDGDPRRKQLEAMAQAMFEKDEAKRRVDREDHLSLYNLLGDPCVRIARPQKLEVEAPATLAVGSTLLVSMKAPFPGKATLVIERGRKTAIRPSIKVKKTDADYRTVYDEANDREVLSVEVDVATDAFGFSIPIPAEVEAGPCAIRVYLVGAKGSAAGGREIELTSGPETPK